MSERPFMVGDDIPLVCTIADVLRITRLGRARFFGLKRIGKLPPWVVQLPGTGQPRYCGATLARWARGEWDTRASWRKAG